MSILQDLLNLGLVEIGGDDSRFAKMEAAATTLVERLTRAPALVIPATLVAIDFDADEDDPIFALVEDLVIDNWKTMRNTHQNRPRQLLRSVIVHALSVLAEGNPEMAAVVWNTANSPVNHGQARLGKETPIVSALLQRLGKQAEDEAALRARLVEPSPGKRRAKQLPDTAPVPTIRPFAPLKDAELLQDVARSAGPQDPLGQAPPDPNPHWPNQGPPWAQQFTPRMTAALVKAVNLGMQRVSASAGEAIQAHLKDIEQRLGDYLKGVETARAEVVAAQKAAQIRLDVLWWAEARYSPTLMQGYRELTGGVAAVAMAYDLSQLVPPLAPASVTYVLGETVAALTRRDGNPLPQTHRVEALLSELRTSGSDLRKLVPGAATHDGRVPLLELTSEAIGGSSVSGEDVCRRAGIDPSLEIPLSSFAMWTFRDMQARRLTGAHK